jgi:hypothetical protein
MGRGGPGTQELGGSHVSTATELFGEFAAPNQKLLSSSAEFMLLPD